MNVLAITNLFPNCYEPRRGMFNLQLFTALSKFVALEVVAPIPYYPGMNLFPGLTHFGRVKRITDGERINDIKVIHPRYPSVPKMCRSFYGLLYYIGIRKVVEELRKGFKFDAILSSFVYPDGYASFLVARRLGIPLFISVLGSDIYGHAKHYFRKSMIRKALLGCNKVVAMSEALRTEVVSYGIPQEKVIVSYNGVNRAIFNDSDKDQAKQTLKLSPERYHILFVGNLVPVKGLDYLVEAMWLLQYRERIETELHIIGRGPLRTSLERRIKKRDLADRVSFVGEKNHDEISLWMKAADVLCLPSMTEGVPNVVLEALSCGTPVVASRVGGIPEVVLSDRQGILTQPGDSEGLAGALHTALVKDWNHNEISCYAARFSWDDSANRLYRELMNTCRSRNE